MKSNSVKWILGIIIVVVIVAIIVTANKKSGNDTVKMAGIYILTGTAAQVGEIQQRATTLAVEKINSSGGINGKKLDVVIADSAYDSKTTLSSYSMLKSQGLKLFITDGSSPAAAIRKSVIDDGNFLIVPAATTPAFFDAENRTCRLAMTAKTFGPALAELALKNGYKRISILLPANEYGKGFAEYFAKALTDKGGTSVVSEFYDAAPGAGDYRTNITKIKAQQANTDAMLFVNTASTIEPMLNQIHDLGWTKPLISDFYTIENPALKNLSLANGVQYVTYQYSSQPQPDDSVDVAAFKSTYFTRFGKYPIFTGAATYDSIMLMSEAVANVGVDPVKVADYISHLKDKTVLTGSVTFNDDCEVSRVPAVAKVVDGKIVNVK